MEWLDSETAAFWWDVGTKAMLGGGIAGIVYLFDRRRRNSADDAHKKIIENNVVKLKDIYTQAALDLNDAETDMDGKSERLNKYMIRNYFRIEYTINNIEIHCAQRTKIPDSEKSAIEELVESSRTILEVYCPQDMPESRRANLWKNPARFHEHNKKIVEAVSAFTT